MTALRLFSAVPGMAVPGMAEPGRDGVSAAPPAGPYQYIGQAACFYLDYLDLATGRTLAPVPGNYYTMAVVSGRPYLSVPPPGRPWNPGNAGAGGTFAELVFRRQLTLPAEVSHGHYPGAGCGHCNPAVPDQPPPPGTGNPDAPQRIPSLAEARAGLEAARAAAGWYQQQPAPTPQHPVPRVVPIRRAPGAGNAGLTVISGTEEPLRPARPQAPPRPVPVPAPPG